MPAWGLEVALGPPQVHRTHARCMRKPYYTTPAISSDPGRCPDRLADDPRHGEDGRGGERPKEASKAHEQLCQRRRNDEMDFCETNGVYRHPFDSEYDWIVSLVHALLGELLDGLVHGDVDGLDGGLDDGFDEGLVDGLEGIGVVARGRFGRHGKLAGD